MVEQIDEEFSQKKQNENSESVYLQLDLAKYCLDAIQKNKSIMPSAISKLKELLEEEQDLLLSSDEENLHENIEIENSDSFDSNELDIDINNFINQFDESNPLSQSD